MEITESALSEHHPGEKQYTGERTSEPHRRSVAYKNGGRWKQRENGAMRVTIGASMIAQRGESLVSICSEFCTYKCAFAQRKKWAACGSARTCPLKLLHRASGSL